MRRAEELGGELPDEVEQRRASTPCTKCPKWQLCPDNYGLDPRNELAVSLYRLGAEDQRVGTFAGAPLMRTISVAAIGRVMDEFHDHFDTPQARQLMLKKLRVLDQVATETRGEIEDKERRDRAAASNNKRAGSSREH